MRSTINVPLPLIDCQEEIPRAVPVQYEFGFCQQTPEPVVNILWARVKGELLTGYSVVPRKLPPRLRWLKPPVCQTDNEIDKQPPVT